MLHIYHGNGKGKTTAAFGLALRSLAYDHKIMIIQFLKDGNSGEMKALSTNTHVSLHADSTLMKFYFQMNEEEKQECRNIQKNLWNHAKQQLPNIDMLILDELLDVLSMGFLDEKEVIEIIHQYKDHVEIVLTGRKPSFALCRLADYISEIKLEKHPFDKGIQARKGIEY